MKSTRSKVCVCVCAITKTVRTSKKKTSTHIGWRKIEKLQFRKDFKGVGIIMIVVRKNITQLEGVMWTHHFATGDNKNHELVAIVCL